MLKFFKKLSLDFIYITTSAAMTLFANILLKIFIRLVMPRNNEIIMIAISLFSSILFSLLLVFIKHYLKNKKHSKNTYFYKYDGVIKDLVMLLKDGEYIIVILLFSIGIICSIMDFKALIIYSPMIWLDNILDIKILASFLSITTVLIVYFVYLLLYRHSLYKDNK